LADLLRQVSLERTGYVVAAAATGLSFFARPYEGIVHDARIYALMALASQPGRGSAGDLFLALGGQREFTLFDELYGWIVASSGLTAAAFGVSYGFRAMLVVAALMSIRRLAAPPAATAGAFLLAVAPLSYGGLGVFHVLEPFTTARTVAEAFALLAIWAVLAGRSWLGAAAIIASALFHPVMALPALLAMATAGVLPLVRRVRPVVLLAGSASLAATLLALFSLLPIVDADWLAIVRDRSPFLFPSTWNRQDWFWNLLPLGTLALYTLRQPGSRSRDLLLTLSLVAATGLVVALACEVRPVRLLVQGQPWRWVWPATALGVLLLPALLMSLWDGTARDRAVALLIGTAWIADAVAGTVLIAAAAVLATGWPRLPGAIRNRVVLLSVLLIALPVAAVALGITDTLARAFPASPGGGMREAAATLLENWPLAVLAAVALCCLAQRTTLVGVLLVAATAATLMGASVYRDTAIAENDGYTAANRQEFAAWRDAIRPGSSVLWPENPVAVWSLLDAPSYLSQAQTAGVLFSRGTAMSMNARADHVGGWISRDAFMNFRRPWALKSPLGDALMQQLCGDPDLAYVVTDQSSGVGLARPVDRKGRRWVLLACQ